MRLWKAIAAALLASAITTATASARDVRVGLASEPTSMDPHFHNLTPNNAALNHVFEHLVESDEAQKPIPGLAESWKPVDDTTWEIRLRKGVKFHDGSDFTADDVIASFARVPNVPNSPSSFASYTRGKTLEKVDDHTIRLRTDKPYPLVPQDLAQVLIVSDKVKDASTADFNALKAAVGTGPYRAVEYVPGDRIVLERFDGYWGEKASFDKVILKPIKSDPARVAALQAGDVDMIEAVPTTDVARLRKDPNIDVVSGLSNRVIYFIMDQFRDETPFVKGKNGEPIKNPFLNKDVRLAILKAINRQGVVDRIMEGSAVPAGQLLPEGFFGVSDKIKPAAYDPNGAKQLLAKAGFPNGFKLVLHGPNDRYVNDAKIVEAAAQMLTRVGIETQIETMPSAVFFRRASQGGPNNTPEFSMALVGWSAGTGEASDSLRTLVHSFDKDRGFGASNRGRYSNPEVDKLIQQAITTVDDEKRQALLAKATEVAMEDVAIVPVHYQVNNWATRKGLKYTPRTDEYTIVRSLKVAP